MSAPVDLAALEALLAKADVHAPLSALLGSADALVGERTFATCEFNSRDVVPSQMDDIQLTREEWDVAEARRDLIVAAVNALPALVRELREARATIATLDADNKRMAEALRNAPAGWLNCPTCGEACTEIAPEWNNEQEGRCGCGASLRVEANGERAWLVDVNEEETADV